MAREVGLEANWHNIGQRQYRFSKSAGADFNTD